ncbi:hypothetical protein IW261DRAFT_1570121 [Armillaria novae-zelandiae]|uniref:Uncharacterized protein n=1 Tax=Armillaria novae-zelandiae TaxID=153914 RepID=A0AA39UBW1_9AGAR|nr:hypothetical protein IW261DRAFT_1570121 [Armillaria novae-zelandiae]
MSIWSHPIFSTHPPDTIPILVVLDNPEAMKPKQINDPWDFYQVLEALKKIEEEDAQAYLSTSNDSRAGDALSIQQTYGEELASDWLRRGK